MDVALGPGQHGNRARQVLTVATPCSAGDMALDLVGQAGHHVRVGPISP